MLKIVCGIVEGFPNFVVRSGPMLKIVERIRKGLDDLRLMLGLRPGAIIDGFHRHYRANI